MNAVESGTLAVRATENYYYERHEEDIARKLQNGHSFYKVLKSTQAFPEDMLIYVDNGETAGELSESMNRASSDFQQRAELNMKTIGTIGWGLMLGFVAIVIGGTVIWLYYTMLIKPINDML